MCLVIGTTLNSKLNFFFLTMLLKQVLYFLLAEVCIWDHCSKFIQKSCMDAILSVKEGGSNDMEISCHTKKLPYIELAHDAIVFRSPKKSAYPRNLHTQRIVIPRESLYPRNHHTQLIVISKKLSYPKNHYTQDLLDPWNRHTQGVSHHTQRIITPKESSHPRNHHTQRIITTMELSHPGMVIPKESSDRVRDCLASRLCVNSV